MPTAADRGCDNTAPSNRKRKQQHRIVGDVDYGGFHVHRREEVRLIWNDPVK